MSNWLFPDREEATDGPDGEAEAIDPADPALDPEQTAIDPEAVDVGGLRPSRVEAGSSVLVAGPPMTGKRRLLFDLVGGSNARTAAFVTSKKPAQKMAAWFAATRPDPDAWDLSFVDCTGSSGSERRSRTRDIVDLRIVSSPGDLTGVGIELSGILRRWHGDSVDDARVGLHSLSTMLMYTETKPLFQFLHAINTRIARVDAVGVYTLDMRPDAETATTLKQLFDSVVEVRSDDEGSEFRVRGGDFGPRSWTTF